MKVALWYILGRQCSHTIGTKYLHPADLRRHSEHDENEDEEKLTSFQYDHLVEIHPTREPLLRGPPTPAIIDKYRALAGNILSADKGKRKRIDKPKRYQIWLKKSSQNRLNTNNVEGSSDIPCPAATPFLHQKLRQYIDRAETGDNASVATITPPALPLRHAKTKKSRPPASRLILQEFRKKVTMHSTTQPLCYGEIQMRRREGKRNMSCTSDKSHKFYSVNMCLESEGYKKAIDFI